MIGLLQCDHVLPQLRGIAGDYDSMFRQFLPAAEWRVYDVTERQRPSDLFECEGYITTGSRASVYDPEPWISAFADLVCEIHRARIPFVGVCFGHQMIGHALGGRVAKCPRGWGIGVHRFQVSGRERWMDPPLNDFRILMSCADQIEQVPSEARVLAGNAHCPVGMLRCGSLLGIQGHPEFTKIYARALMEFRRERIGPEPVDAALATLKGATDSSQLSQWIHNFLLRDSQVTKT